MEVEAVSETRRAFAGSRVSFVVEFQPLGKGNTEDSAPPVLLSGYAVVQGFFKLGETLSTEPFQETRKAGIVLGKRGFEYGQPSKSGGFLQGVLGGLRHLVINSSDNNANTLGNSGPNGGLGPSVINGNNTNLDSETVGDDGHDYPIFATSQLLLFTDLKLDAKSAGQRRFRIAVDLPRHLPPTYRSRSLQIMYTLVVGFQRPVRDGKPIETRLFLPFRVLSPAPTPAVPTPLVYDLRYPVNAPPPVLLSATDAGGEFPGSAGSVYDNYDGSTGALNSPVGENGPVAENAENAENSDMHDPAGERADMHADTPVDKGEGKGVDMPEGKVADEDTGKGNMQGNAADMHSDMQSTGSTLSAPIDMEKKKPQTADDKMNAFIDKLLSGNHDSEQLTMSPGRHLDSGIGQYTKVNYALSRSGSSIASVVLAKPAVSIGDVIAAQVKLHRPCLHLSAYLELQETIAAPYSATTAGSYTGAVTQEEAEAEKTVISTTYARRFQSVYGLQELALYFPTLTSTTPRLDTEQLTASWVLHLEFVGLTGSALAETDDDEECLEAKGQVDYEMFSCKIPLVILPPTSMGHTVAKVWKFQ